MRDANDKWVQEQDVVAVYNDNLKLIGYGMVEHIAQWEGMSALTEWYDPPLEGRAIRATVKLCLTVPNFMSALYVYPEGYAIRKVDNRDSLCVAVIEAAS